MANANSIASLSNDLSLTLTGIGELGDVLATAMASGGVAQYPWACCLVFSLLAKYAQLQLDQIHALTSEVTA
jgi:hypothetical protein